MSEQGYSGQLGLTDDKSDYNAQTFVIEQMLASVRTMTLVKVVAVDADAKTVDVHPLVNQVDGVGTATPHGDVLNLAYFRLQAGSNAIIVDPEVGDIGIAGICDRDISAVKATKAEASPGSKRRFSLADGIYFGGALNGDAEQSMAFTSSGIKLSDKNGNVIEMKSGSIAVTTQSFTVNGSIIAGFGTADAINVQTHKHPTAATGAPSSPTPGT